MSADTGAREPAIAKIVNYCETIERWRTWAQDGAAKGHRLEEDRLIGLSLSRDEAFELRAALAAGVGVPPDEESGSAASGALDPYVVARTFHEEYERLAPGYGYETREDSAVPWDEVPYTNRQLMVATAKAVIERLAGVGEARPAEPGTALERAFALLRSVGCEGIADEAEAEYGRLRQQLDAANEQKERWAKLSYEGRDQLLDALNRVSTLTEQLDAATQHIAQALDYLENDGPLVEFACDSLRAALGVVGPPPNQTTDEVSALGQKASETREGES